ncbi:MAG: hypothetical protein M3O15_11115 [Acidobacteriota bacterium]|nr:hypothetical protein [Acidobacteriota bacterium]
MSRRWCGVFAKLAVVTGAVLSTAATTPAPGAAPAAGRSKALVVVSDTALGPAFEWAKDVRWASDSAVYLALAVDGTVQLNLGETVPKEIVPGRSRPGGFWSAARVGASTRYLVVAGPALSLTWQAMGNPSRSEKAVEVIEGIDVQDNRLALLGAQRDAQGRFGGDGAIAWIGSLDRNLDDLKPIAYDVGGPGVPSMNRCMAAGLGAVRFLADGTLLLVAGVQPGVELYDEKGTLLRTWETAKLGIDTDCGGLSEAQRQRILGSSLERITWVNQRRTVDTVLPFAQGAGLVVRRVEKGHTLWDLKVLGRNGSVETQPLPFVGPSEYWRLQGDVRSGKVVFLLYELAFRGVKNHPAPPHLIVARFPGG